MSRPRQSRAPLDNELTHNSKYGARRAFGPGVAPNPIGQDDASVGYVSAVGRLSRTSSSRPSSSRRSPNSNSVSRSRSTDSPTTRARCGNGPDFRNAAIAAGFRAAQTGVPTLRRPGQQGAEQYV